MFLSRFVCLFIIYSLVGWIYESLFCTVSSGKWENRGFLYGPCCPIYGTGAVAISIVMSMITASGYSFVRFASSSSAPSRSGDGVSAVTV